MLHEVLREHLESFLALTGDDGGGGGLPRFVRKELRGFLSCGILARGFARFRCQGCGFDRLVAYSCKGRGFCASCGGKRMTALAAHLVDHVIHIVPTRQYVLSLPYALRARLAYGHSVQKQVLAIFARALLRSYEQRAADRGIRNARTGAVTFVQRFGSALNLHTHFHTHVLDGVFTENVDSTLSFHALPPPTPAELRVLLSVVRYQVLRYAVAHDLLADDAIPELALDAPALATLVGASTHNVRALGPRPGTPVQRALSGIDPLTLPPRRKARLSANQDGFDIHAALSIRPRQRKVLERVLRYCARPASAHDRLERLPEGRIRLALKTPWHDGTRHLLFEPLELIGRLTALIPRPHKNLLVYHGVLAPRSKWRGRVVAYRRPAKSSETTEDAASSEPEPRARHHNREWAALMHRAFELDVLGCPTCGGRMKLIACITDATVIRRMLRHLHLPADAPEPHPARAPPWAQPDPYEAA